MPDFSPRSQTQLETCHPDLQRLFAEVIKTENCTVIEGHRGEADQDADYAAGKTQLKWPHGKHNALPSLAVDATPYPVDFKNTKRLILFAGIVLGTAARMGLKVRWGGDWAGKLDPEQNHFDDLVHFELM